MKSYKEKQAKLEGAAADAAEKAENVVGKKRPAAETKPKATKAAGTKAKEENKKAKEPKKAAPKAKKPKAVSGDEVNAEEKKEVAQEK